MGQVGIVSELWRYPVKSMLGESLPRVEVTRHGLPGDRALAFVDEKSGKVVSAKLPAKWRAMLGCSARTDDAGGDAPLITLPDGTEISAGDPGVADRMSGVLGRRVTLRRDRRAGDTVDRAVPEEVIERGLDAEVEFTLLEIAEAASAAPSFVDYAPLHLMTSATLQAIARAAGHDVEAVRYRPNLVIDTGPAAGFVENDWVGSTLTIGDLVLRLVLPTPRCAIPTLAHGELSRDHDAVRTLLEVNRIPVEGFGVLPSAGVYAEVLTPARIAVGDSVHLS
ncbi:MAG: MOSC domain-containing protein [Nocardioides sp.]